MEQLVQGKQMYNWARDLFPIARSITGEGVRETLGYIQKLLPELTIKEVASGTKVFDWIIPEEWNIREGFIEDEDGNKIVDFKDHNLHVVGYSEPVDKWLSLVELQEHLYSLPDQPNAIPYITSYYKRRWGFCLTDRQRKSLKDGRYRVYIDTDFKEDGVLNYGELLIPGKSEEEVFLSTYVCHPSMANNELSGPVLASALGQWLTNQEELYYSYRIIFVPETIGAITYISQNLKTLQKNVIGGYQITCVGDERTYSYLPSRYGNTYSDKIALHVLRQEAGNFDHYSFLDRGSDERQYCSPGVDLPIASVMRSKYGTYPEYHTSLDDLSLVTPNGLQGAFDVYKSILETFERNCYPKVTVYCEPQMGKRDLYPTLSQKGGYQDVRNMMDMLTYSDGRNDLVDIGNYLNVPCWQLSSMVTQLLGHNLLELDSGNYLI